MRPPGPPRIDEGVHADFGQHAGLAGGRVGVHVEEDAAGEVVGLDLVGVDHLPDLRRRHRGRTARIRAGDHPLDQPRLGDMVDARRSHTCRRRRWDGSSSADCGAPSAANRSPIARSIASGQPRSAGRADRDGRAVGDQPGSLSQRDDFRPPDSHNLPCASVLPILVSESIRRLIFTYAVRVRSPNRNRNNPSQNPPTRQRREPWLTGPKAIFGGCRWLTLPVDRRHEVAYGFGVEIVAIEIIDLPLLGAASQI